MARAIKLSSDEIQQQVAEEVKRELTRRPTRILVPMGVHEVSDRDLWAFQLAQAIESAGAIDTFSPVRPGQVEHGLNDDQFQAAMKLVDAEGFLDRPTFDGKVFLNRAGREFVRSGGRFSGSGAVTVQNNDFSGASIQSSNIATGGNVSQRIHITNAVDTEAVETLLETARQLPVNNLAGKTRDEYEEDLEVLEAQLAEPSVRVPGLKGAVRRIQAVGEKVLVGAAAKGLLGAGEAVLRSLA